MACKKCAKIPSKQVLGRREEKTAVSSNLLIVSQSTHGMWRKAV